MRRSHTDFSRHRVKEKFGIKIPASAHFWLGFCGNIIGWVRHVAQFCAHDPKCAKNAQEYFDKILIINLLMFFKIFLPKCAISVVHPSARWNDESHSKRNSIDFPVQRQDAEK